MQAFLSKGGLTGLLTFAAGLAAVFGKNQLAAVLGDPTTATSVGIVFTGIGAIVAGFLPNHTPAA